MATKQGSKGGRGRSGVSLTDEDRRYISESLGAARGQGAASGSESEGGLFEALERFGLSSDRVERLRTAIDDMEVGESINKAQDYLAEQIESARDYARGNPGKVIGGAAGVLVGASLLAIALRRASGEEKRSSARSASTKSSKKSSGSRSSKSSKKSGGGGRKPAGSSRARSSSR